MFRIQESTRAFGFENFRKTSLTLKTMNISRTALIELKRALRLNMWLYKIFLSPNKYCSKQNFSYETMQLVLLTQNTIKSPPKILQKFCQGIPKRLYENWPNNVLKIHNRYPEQSVQVSHKESAMELIRILLMLDLELQLCRLYFLAYYRPLSPLHMQKIMQIAVASEVTGLLHRFAFV